MNESTAIRHVMFKGIWPTAPRDFIICTTWSELSDGSILISSRSAWNELLSIQKNHRENTTNNNEYVRGYLNISGYHIIPCHGDNEKGCDIVMCAHSDLGGTLPVGIINMLAFAAPVKMLAAITALTRD